MKMIAGAASLALANRSRTREAPTPTIASMNSEAAIEKNAACASPATARASSVLPVPGGPDSSTPWGIRPPSRSYGVGISQEVDDLGQLGLGLVDPGHVVERDPDLLGVDPPRLRAPEVARARPCPPPDSRAPREQHEQTDDQQRRAEAEQELGEQRRALVRGRLGVDLDALGLQASSARCCSRTSAPRSRTASSGSPCRHSAGSAACS